MSLEYSIDDDDSAGQILEENRVFDLKRFIVTTLPIDTYKCKEYEKYPFYVFRPYIKPDIEGIDEKINKEKYPEELYVFALIPSNWTIMESGSGSRFVYFDETNVPRFVIRDNKSKTNRKVSIKHLIEKTSYICDKIEDHESTTSLSIAKTYMHYDCSCCRIPT